MPKLKTIRDIILLTHTDRLIDDDECLLLYDLNQSKNLDLPYLDHNRFDLDELNEDQCKSEFRFTKRDILQLCEVFRIPDEIRCYNGVVFQKEEVFCIFEKCFS